MNEKRYKRRMEVLKKLPLREQIRRLKVSCGKYRFENAKLRKENIKVDYYVNEGERLKQNIQRLQKQYFDVKQDRDTLKNDKQFFRKRYNRLKKNWFVKLFLIKKHG